MPDQTPQPPWRRYKCLNCGTIYAEEAGCPDQDVPPGTRWEDLPEDWICIECGSEKRDFTLIDWE